MKAPYILILSLIGCQLSAQAQIPAPPEGWVTKKANNILGMYPPGHAEFDYFIADSPARIVHSPEQDLEQVSRIGASKFGTIKEQSPVEILVKDKPGIPTIWSRFLSIQQDGKPYSISYLAYSANQTMHYAFILYPANGNYKPFLDKAVAHFLLMAKTDKGTTPARENAGGPAVPGNMEPSSRPITPPAGALTRAGIEGYIFVTTYSYGVGGMMTSSFEPYLLLKDGSVRKNLSIPPEFLNVQQSKQEEPANWGKWSRSGKRIQITWNNGKQENWDNWYYGFPAADGEKLSGTFHSLGGGGGGGTLTFVAQKIRFSPGGQFTTEKQRGATTENGPYGSKTAQSNGSGTYHLNGYTLTLTFNNGKVANLPFLFYSNTKTGKPVKDTGAFILAGDNYSLDK